jgi:penicillin-binding protein 2
MEIEDAFRHVQWTDKNGNVEEEHEMHGAAVVIDVPTGQVRALVSYPTYDPNKFGDLYPVLQADLLNLPLMNRATQMALEPGSTVKPMVGIGAITQGLRGVNEGHECTGYLIIDGRRYSTIGRCWTAKRFASVYGEKGVAHHAFGADPHPTGFLTFSDALQRSCNVYFESLGDRLKLQGLSYWFGQFGLGRRTGIGIAEATGRLPNQFDGPAESVKSVQWFSAIGQSQVAATPLQMANVAATIARNGVWMRPTLLLDENQRTPLPATQPVELPPQRVELKVFREAVAAAKDGMIRVVNSVGGTGKSLKNDRVLIAAKTGTAQVQPLRIARRDTNGEILRNEKGRIIYDEPPIGTRQHPNPDLPWYRSTNENTRELSHAWIIGFAPAHNPKIAFAVMLEYGGGGGSDASIVAKAVLDACMEHEYLAPER